MYAVSPKKNAYFKNGQKKKTPIKKIPPSQDGNYTMNYDDYDVHFTEITSDV